MHDEIYHDIENFPDLLIIKKFCKKLLSKQKELQKIAICYFSLY